MQQDLDKLRGLAEQHCMLLATPEPVSTVSNMDKLHVPPFVKTFIPTIQEGGQDSSAANTACSEPHSAQMHRVGLSAPPMMMSSNVTAPPVWNSSGPSKVAAQLILQAMLANPYLSKLAPPLRMAICRAMQPMYIKKGDVLMSRGETGDRLYVTETGLFEIRQQSGNANSVGPGQVLGEMAILYNCSRTATVIAIAPACVWYIDRATFQYITMKSALDIQHQHVELLSQINLCQGFSRNYLFKLAQALTEVHFAADQDIFQQGDTPDYFYLLLTGEVAVHQKRYLANGEVTDVRLRTLGPGSHFGEASLMS